MRDKDAVQAPSGPSAAEKAVGGERPQEFWDTARSYGEKYYRDVAFHVVHLNLTARTIHFKVQQDNPGFWYRLTPVKPYIPPTRDEILALECQVDAWTIHYGNER